MNYDLVNSVIFSSWDSARESSQPVSGALASEKAVDWVPGAEGLTLGALSPVFPKTPLQSGDQTASLFISLMASSHVNYLKVDMFYQTYPQWPQQITWIGLPADHQEYLNAH